MSECPRPLVIAGAGGFARETAEAVMAINRDRPVWDLLGFVDDDPGLVGSQVVGFEVLGEIALVRSRLASAQVVVCTGRPTDYFSRPRIVRRLALPPERFATIVHPTVSAPASTEFGRGSVIMAGVVVTAACRIGDHVAVMPLSVVTHDDLVDDYATLASGVILGGSVHIRRGAYLGAGSLVREGLDVGEWSLVGMGSVVTRSVPAGEQWFGSPARRRAAVTVPDDL